MFKVSGMLICSIMLFSIITGSAKESTIKWETDLANAQKIATAQKKDIFVFFTGSDWCTFCIMLHKEVFDKGNFLEEINKKYVLLEIDFPQRKPFPEAIQIKNDKLAEDYEIQKFPTIFIVFAVIMQPSKDGGLGGLASGGVTDSVFGTNRNEFLAKTTWWLLAIFLISSLVLAKHKTREHNEREQEINTRSKVEEASEKKVVPSIEDSKKNTENKSEEIEKKVENTLEQIKKEA